VEPAKTKVLEFGRDAERNARGRGERPGRFDFLGFTHYCSRTKDGRRFRMKRVTSRKRFRAKLTILKEWLKRSRIMPTLWILEKVGLKLRGHYAYYGVTDNHQGIARFYRETTKMLYKWLNRRSQRRSYRWAEFEELLKLCPLPRPRVRVHRELSVSMRDWAGVNVVTCGHVKKTCFALDPTHEARPPVDRVSPVSPSSDAAPREVLASRYFAGYSRRPLSDGPHLTPGLRQS
jgi:hypothetical protein